MTSDGGASSYYFVDRWRIRGSAQEVAEVLQDVGEYPRWWPSTYIEVTREERGDERGVGMTGRVLAKGWLPYRIRFAYRVTESVAPRRFALAAAGDLTGRGVWDIEQDGDWVDATFTWTVRSDKVLLQRLSFLLKPLFAGNHRWTMRRGERSLQLEIDRRHAAAARTDPPRPVPDAAWWAALGASLAAASCLIALAWRRRRRSLPD